MADFIYQMQGVDVVLPSGRTILKPTHLSFFPDAKIGVIGHNGAENPRSSKSWRA